MCLDPTGQESVWWSILWMEGALVSPECIALHEPPELPTRYSLWERTDERGTSTFGHRVYDGRNLTATLQDLVLRKNGSAQVVTQVTGYIAETDRLTWPSRSETELTWVRTQRGLSFLLDGESSMDCVFDEDIANSVTRSAPSLLHATARTAAELGGSDGHDLALGLGNS